VVRLGAPAEPLTETRTAYTRYRGQGHEISVDLPAKDYGPDDAAIFAEAFDREYRALYSRTIPRLEIEVLTWTLSLATDRALPEAASAVAESYRPEPAGYRMVFDPDLGRTVEAAIHERAALRPGATVTAPAVIVEDETSTFVANGFTAAINRLGQIVLSRETEQA
jgi:N-methylhydantoinase A